MLFYKTYTFMKVTFILPNILYSFGDFVIVFWFIRQNLNAFFKLT